MVIHDQEITKQPTAKRFSTIADQHDEPEIQNFQPSAYSSIVRHMNKEERNRYQQAYIQKIREIGSIKRSKLRKKKHVQFQADDKFNTVRHSQNMGQIGVQRIDLKKFEQIDKQGLVLPALPYIKDQDFIKYLDSNQ